jgi:hypothetical protein
MRQFTAVMQDRKHGPYRTQRLTASSPMELLLHLLERKQSVVDVRDDRQLPPLARKRIKPLDKVLFFEQLESSAALGLDSARAMEIAHVTTEAKNSWPSSLGLNRITRSKKSPGNCFAGCNKANRSAIPPIITLISLTLSQWDWSRPESIPVHSPKLFRPFGNWPPVTKGFGTN